jgi:hypothetical protein
LKWFLAHLGFEIDVYGNAKAALRNLLSCAHTAQSELKGYLGYKKGFPCALELFLAHLGFKD